MKRWWRKWAFGLLAVVLIPVCGLLCSACNDNFAGNSVYVVSITENATDESQTSFTVTYSNGATSKFSVMNGRDGANGQPGRDGADVDIKDIYAAYCAENNCEISFNEFLQLYLKMTVPTDNATVINQCLLSSLKLYTEFTESQVTTDWGAWRPTQSVQEITKLYLGSAVIYQIDRTQEAGVYTGDAYILTNYHVIYDASAISNDKIAEKIVGFLYGSRGEYAGNGATGYVYSEDALTLSYVGGSLTYDIAILKVPTADLLAVNPQAVAVTCASDYYVGETAYAIGNAEGYGISVTEGIISVDNEEISLNIDNTKARIYRAIRIDTSIYEGNSGGGLFNKQGQLIGITNAGDGNAQNINYAVPLPIVTGVADNIIYNYEREAADQRSRAAWQLTLGVTVTVARSQYVYDTTKGYGQIVETILVKETVVDSIAAGWNLQADDQIMALVINGQSHSVTRNFALGDWLLTVRPGDTVQLQIQRAGEIQTTTAYVVQGSDLKTLA